MWSKVLNFRIAVFLTSIFLLICSYFNLRSNTSGTRSCVNVKLELMDRELFKYMSFYLRNKPYPGPLNYTNYIIARRNAKPLLSVKPIRADFIPVYNDVRAFNYSYFPRCSPSSSKVSLFVAVISAPANFEKRKVIRETWFNVLASQLNALKLSDVELLGSAFVLGQSENQVIENQVLSESSTYGDILQIGITDAYYNLTLKLTGLLNWLDTKCETASFLFKVDDDVFVNSRNLGVFINQIKDNEPSIYCASNDGIIQRKTSKWKLSYEDFPWQSYPHYCEGAAMMFDGDAIRILLASAQSIPYLKFDDVFYSGFVAPKAGISLMMGESIIPDLHDDEPGPCLIRNSVSLLLAKNNTQMKPSHLAAEKFYANETQCVLDGVAVDPNEAVGFPLTRINSSEQNLLFQMAEITKLSQ